MRFRGYELLLAQALAACLAIAATQISDDDMNSLLDAGGVELAYRYAPLWFFGKAMDQSPCVPDWTFGGSPDSSDVYDDDHMTKPAPRCEYPDVGCECRTPGNDTGRPAPPFPVYYTFQKCNDSDVRVAYNLFYQKDGADAAGIIDTGHD